MTTTTRPSPTPPATPPPDSVPPPVTGRPAAAVTVGLLFVVVGTIALLGTIGVEVPWTTVAPAVLVLIGLGIVVSAVRGEAEGGLVGLAVVVGVLLALGALTATILDVPLRGGVGERRHQPAVAEELADEYRLMAGTLVVDLRDLELAPGTTDLEVTTVLGEVEVWLPDGLAVDVEASVGGGSAVVLGEVREGMGLDVAQRSEDWVGADQRLHLQVGVGLGEVRVTGG